jgi:hypothetical protein
VIGFGKVVLTEKMTKRFSAVTLQFFLLALFLGFVSLPVCSQNGSAPFSLNESPLPAPTSPVMDYVGVLDANTKQALEQRIIAFRDSTNPRVELAVAIVATTGERPIFDYSWRSRAAGKSVRPNRTIRARYCLLLPTTASTSRRSAKI